MHSPVSPKLRFDLASEEHRSWLHSLYTNHEIRAKIPGGAMDAAQAQTAVERAVNGFTKHGLGYWVVSLKEQSAPVGYVVLRPFEWDVRFNGVEIGYIIDKKSWGRGIASEAVEAVVDFAVKELKLNKMLALVNDENLASIKIIEKNRFKKNPLILARF